LQPRKKLLVEIIEANLKKETSMSI